jgi:hypothetical protein
MRNHFHTEARKSTNPNQPVATWGVIAQLQKLIRPGPRLVLRPQSRPASMPWRLMDAVTARLGNQVCTKGG